MAFSWLIAAGDRVAADTLVAPSSITLHVHADIADTGFLAQLEPILARRLMPRLRIVASAIDLAPFRARFGPMAADPLLQAFVVATHVAADPTAMHVLLIAEDIRAAPARFNFAVTAGGRGTGFRATVVSLARLQQRGLLGTSDTDPLGTALRVSRMIVKNVARTAGLVDSARCVMGFPSSLAELDAMPEGFCEPDLSALVAAGIARR